MGAAGDEDSPDSMGEIVTGHVGKQRRCCGAPVD